MKIIKLFSILMTMFAATSAFAQHSDIRFSYEDDAIVLREGVEGFGDGVQIFEGTFPTSGFSIRFTENPGFLVEIANMDMLLPGDDIQIEILQSNTFGSFLTYYDPMADAMMPTDATITIDDNMGGNTADLVIGNTELGGENPQFIQTAGSTGEVHSHIDFILSDVAEFGAYGILFRLSATNNPSIADSEPIWLVFGYGMSPSEFVDFAIPAFVGEEQVIIGDLNGDGMVNLLDIAPFIDAITEGIFSVEADINGDGAVNLLDVNPFIELLSN